MSRTTTKLTLSLVALIAVFAFLYLFTGVFGDTKIGITLRTNPDLENGLVAHYTFDGDYEQGTFEFGTGGATTTDLSSSGDRALGIAADVSGYIYVAGFCNGCGSAGSEAAYVYKAYPLSGSMIWATSTDTSSFSDRANAIATDESGNVYVSGWCQINCAPQGGRAIYTYKIDPTNGDMIWATTTDPTANNDEPSAITTDNNGNLFVAGYCDGCGTFGGWAGYLLKINPEDGALLWATTTDPSNTFDYMQSVATDNSGNAYVTGYCTDCGDNGGRAIYTYKVDGTNGDMLWATTTDPTGTNDEGTDITTDDVGNVYVTGYCDACTGGNGIGYYTFKVDPNNGDMLWVSEINPTSGTDIAYGIVHDNNGGVIVTGVCAGCSGGVDNEFRTYRLLDTDGSMDWTSTEDPTANNDTVYEIDYDGKGNVYLAGYCDGCGSDAGHAFHVVKLNASDGTIVDTTSAGAVGAVGVQKTAGNIGQGVKFDGVDDYIDLGSAVIDPTDEQITLSAWVKPGDLGANGVLIGKREVSPNDGFALQLRAVAAGDPWRFTINGIVDQDSNATGLVQDEWVHIAVTYDKSNITFYQNGSQLSQHAQTGDVDDASGLNLFIGASNWDGSPLADNFFNGIIDDARIYNRALSANEVSRLYDLGATTKINKTLDSNPDLKEGLVLHTTFDGREVDTSSTTGEITDRSGKNPNGNWSYDIDNTYGYSSVGVIGQGMYLTGDSSRVDIGVTFSDSANYSGLDSVTASVWVKPDSWPTSCGASVCQQVLVGKTNYSDNREWRLRRESSGNVIAWQLSSDGTGSGGGYSSLEIDESFVPPQEWSHIVGLWDGSESRIYINGIEINQASFSQANLYDGSANLGIGDSGNNSNDNQDNFLGTLDDVRVYSRALSDEEILRLYQLGATTKINKTITTNPDLKNGLVGHWTFDGPDTDWGSTTAEIVDISGNGNDGNAVSMAVGNAKLGKLGQALDFDGSAEYIQVNSDSELDDLNDKTISVWIRPDSSGENNTGTIVNKQRRADGSDWWLGINGDNRIEYWQDYSGTDRRTAFSNSYEVGKWGHLVFTISSSTAYTGVVGYLNGEPLSYDAGSSVNGVGGILSDAVNTLYIGDQSSGARAFDGRIDDLRLYNRVLSANEITRLYQLGQ